MKKIIYLFLFVFLVGFVLACEGCSYNSACYDYGDIVLIGNVDHYCSFDGTLNATKTNGSCLNDFECREGYSCLSDQCTNQYNNFILYYNAVLAGSGGLCVNQQAGWFCSNVSVSNSSVLANKTCNYPSQSCRICNGSLKYNQSIEKCISGICSSPYKCLNITSLSNASSNSDYCADNKVCFNCDEDFEWNGTIDQCKMKECSSSPGCSNETNITYGQIITGRHCESGSCWTCKCGYTWNSSSSSCIYTSNCGANVNWTTVVFTDSELSSGAYKLLNLYDSVGFSFESRNYLFGILGIDSTKIVFRISPINVNNYNLFVGSSAQFNLAGDSANDLRISLAGISNGKANVSIKFLSIVNPDDDEDSVIIDDVISDDSADLDVYDSSSDGDPINLGFWDSQGFFRKNAWWLVLIGVAIIVLLVWLIVYLVNNKPKNNTGTNSQTGQQQPPVAPGNAYGSYPVGGYRPLIQSQQNVQKRM